jgi:hypothetical protein
MKARRHRAHREMARRTGVERRVGVSLLKKTVGARRQPGLAAAFPFLRHNFLSYF